MLNGLYSQYFNCRHKRVGHLFQGRYKSFIIEKESYLLEVCRYIVLNPIRSKLAKKIDEWEWSSYRSTAGIDTPKGFSALNDILSLFSSSKLSARKQYVQFIESGLGKKDIYEDSHGGMILGSKMFAKEIMEKTKNKNSEEFIKREQNVGRPELSSILLGKKKVEEIITAVIQWNYKQKEVADFLELHYSTVSKIVKENSRFKT